MSTTVRRLIEKALRFHASRQEIAAKLQVGPERLSQWQSGARPMPNEQLIELAYMGGEDPVEALGRYHWERANPGKRRAAAALIAYATAALGAIATPSDTQAMQSAALGAANTLHIMRRQFGRFLARLRRSQVITPGCRWA